MGSKCPKCSRDIGPEQSFCPYDGTPIDTEVMDPLLGIKIEGRYLLKDRIGGRGRFVVYSGEDVEDGRSVLVTAATSGSLGARALEALETFNNLGEQVVHLEQAHLTRVVHYGRTAEGVLFVVEEGEGYQPLGLWLRQKGHLPTSTAFELINQLMDGLDRLHQRDLVHGNLRTTRIWMVMGDDDQPRLRIPLSDILCNACDPIDGTRPPTVAGDLEAAVQLLVELLGENPGESLDQKSAQRLQNIIDRGLGEQGSRFDTAKDLKSELENLAGQSRFGRYSLLQSIGRGGMGEIYLARAEGLEGVDINRLCVIKTVRTSLADEQSFVERFLSEARVLASLSHGNIVPVYDVGKVGKTFYIAMEHVAGQDLKEILSRAAKQKKRIPVPMALLIARELANGLAYAHRAKMQGIGELVHRDVSPHNVLVSYEGEVKLIDFGLVQGAKVGHESKDGIVVGKVCYLSPEQAMAEPLDRRTDIYSAGLVLFEMLVGEPFFNQDSVEEVMAHVAHPVPTPPSDRMPGIPTEVDSICMRAMAAHREERYPNAGDLRDDLAAALARIAPRTNPEEVGAFVQELFPGEQVKQERLLSDLSVTLPPQGSEHRGERAGDAEGQSSQGYSLLGVTPKPVQLAPTMTGPLGPFAGFQTQRRTAVVEQPMVTEVVIPERRLKWPLMTMVGMILLGVGIALGLWLFQRKPSTVVLVKPPPQPEVHLRAVKQEPGDPAIASKKKQPVRAMPRKRRPVTRLAGGGSHECRLTVQGGPPGAIISVNGTDRGRLPLDRPLKLSPGVMHRIEIRKGQLLPFKQSLRCRSGERLNLRLGVR